MKKETLLLALTIMILSSCSIQKNVIQKPVGEYPLIAKN